MDDKATVKVVKLKMRKVDDRKSGKLLNADLHLADEFEMGYDGILILLIYYYYYYLLLLLILIRDRVNTKNMKVRERKGNGSGGEM